MFFFAPFWTSCYSAQVSAHKDSVNSFLDVKYSQNTTAVPMYEVFELTFKHENKYEKPFFDVTIDVIFTSPSKRQIKIGDFKIGDAEKEAINNVLDSGQISEGKKVAKL